MTNYEQKHIPVYCSICGQEATRWYEEEDGKDDTVYVCLDHPQIQDAEEKGTLVNAQGKEVELAVYCCSGDCTCDVCP
jgi:hypothetical protein